MPFQHLTLGKGQDINFAYNIVQDSKGFMWFCTLDGLVRYDGYTSRQYNKSNNSGLKGRRVNHLEEDRFGHFWVVSGSWLQVYISEEDAFLDITNLAGDSTFRYSHPKFKPLMVQDTSGTIWMRSTKGLFRIEPNQQVAASSIRRYRYDGGDAAANDIQILFVDSQQRLWVGTNKGLLLFNREKARLESVPIEIDAAVIALCETSDGHICLGTEGAGFIIYDPATQNARRFLSDKNEISAIAGKTVHQIACDGKGNIWLFAGSLKNQVFSLQRFDAESGQFVTYLQDDKAKGGVALMGGVSFRLFTDSKGYLWAVTGNGLKRFDPFQEKMYDINDGENHLNGWSSVYHFYEDRTGVIWLGTMAEGALKFAPSTMKFQVHVTKPMSGQEVAPNFLFPLFFDSQGHLWNSTNLGTGQFAFDADGNLQKIAHFPNQTHGFFEDSQSRLWMSSLKGTRLFDLISNEFLPNSSSLVLNNSLFVKMEDDEGWLWSLMAGKGLLRFNPATGDTIHYQHELSNPHSLSSNALNPVMIKDSDGHLWFGGQNGLNRFDLKTGAFTHYLKGKETVEIFEDHADQIWVTTTGVGLYCIDKKKGNSKKYGTENGFPTNRPLFIQEDENGDLWISSDVGLIHFMPDSETWKIYDEEDGLPEPVFAYGTCKRENGEMFFSMWNGVFIQFHPDSLNDDQFRPVTGITDFKLFNKKVEIGGENSPLQSSIWTTDHLVLKHDQNVFTLEYSAFHYAAPGKNQFAYFMEGLDEEWNQVGAQRIVNFAGMQPGKYTFQVKAANHDGIWGEPTVLKISILPPWWATWWAYLGYVLLAAGLAFAFYFYKKKQWKLLHQLELEHREAERLMELDSVKTRLYTNITHEFRTPLTVILGMAKQVKNNPGEWFSEGLKMIERNGRNLLHLVNQMLDLSKLEAGALPVQMVQSDVVAFLKYLLESFHSLAEGKNIRLDFQSETEMLMMDFDPEKLREIVSNLLSNAIKFTPEGGEVAVSIDLSNFQNLTNLSLAVSDTGPGIPPEKLPRIFNRFYSLPPAPSQGGGGGHSSPFWGGQEGAGIGLSLTKELVKLLGGEITVKSVVGQNTTFTVTLPVHQEAPLQTLATGEEAVPPIPQFPNSPILQPTDERPILLLVEDNGDVLTYLRSILSENYFLEEARNGREGIEKAIELVPDLIVSDVMMPEADGFELCATLKKDERTSHIPIILLTAKADAASRLEGLECGADAYLAKPFEKDELLVRTRKLLELRQRLWEQFTTNSLFTPLPGKTLFVQDEFLEKLKTVLGENFSNENFDIPQLCEALLMSRAQLYRKVKALTGESVGHLLRSYRMQRAKALLETTDLSVSQIALEVGFRHLAHFSRSFQQEFGVNPSEVRK